MLCLIAYISPLATAQDSSTMQTNKKTLVIRKKKKINQIKMVSPPKIEKKITKEKPSRLPTIAGGEFGLLDIRPYQNDTFFYNWNYVILQYDVNQYGWAINIADLGHSSPKFAAYVIRKLKQAKWNPALDAAGKAIDYQLYQQVVIVKYKLYEEPFTTDY